MYKENYNTEDVLEEESISDFSNNNYSQNPEIKISVIIPVYFEEKILESVISYFTPEFINQYNLEVIVSDGGSTDNTVEIAKKYTDKVVIHKESRRQTISEGRNKGADLAQGKILVFINGDTIPADPHKFFTFINNWADGNIFKNIEALACRVSMNPVELTIKDKIFYSLHNKYVKLLNVTGFGMARGECQLMTKNIFTKVHGYNPFIAAGEDFELYNRIAKITKIKYYDDLVVYESPRRFRKYGYLRVLSSWIINALTVIFFGKSMSKDWEAVR